MARYIDADEFLKYIKANAPYMYTMVAIMAGVMPTADVVEVKHGEWIEKNPQSSRSCRLVKCSECDDTYIVAKEIKLDVWSEGRNYCTKCGAKMDGGIKNE